MTSGLRGLRLASPRPQPRCGPEQWPRWFLHFFPGAKTAGCNIETHIFSEGTDQFTAQKATLVGITAGNIYKVADYSKDTEYCAGKFPLLADPGTKIAKQDDSLLGMNPRVVGPRLLCDFSRWPNRSRALRLEGGRPRRPRPSTP